MSEFRDDLLISPINKKRIVGIFLITILLISIFTFSVLLYSFLFESQRPYPSDKLSEAEWEDADLTLPPSPYNISDLEDLFNNLNLTQDQLQQLIDTLQDMFDGDIQDLDLGNFSQSQLALLASEVEVFRVYEYDFFTDMTNKLWKYECFDEYSGDGWHSTAATQLSDFYSYSNYSAYHSDKDLLRIRMPLSPSIGVNSFVIPTLFPRPFIMEDSFYSVPPTLTPGSEVLYIDDLNSSILESSFSSTEDTNLSYYLFGLDLPDNNQINTSAVEARYTPPALQSRYLQLPPSINVYLANNPYVYNHYVILNNTINKNDNAFVVANKIRNYLQTYFTFPLNPDDYNPAPDGRDSVDWFCETQQGVWADFASAFCVFARLFGIASRFVDGFNSVGIQEFWDPVEMNNTFSIKYRNLYNWAEIYIPTDVLGNGQWVQMDVLFDSFGAGGNPIIGGNYSVSVSSDKFIYNRPDMANITAFLSSSTEPIDNKRITFRDVSTGEILGSTFTDLNGEASIFTDINNSKIVGPHVIEARFDFFVANYTFFIIEGDIQVRLTNVNPTTLNSSEPLNIRGYLYDPVKREPVKDARVNFNLFQYGTNSDIPNAFIPPFQYTYFNGDFSNNLTINPSVNSGQYEIRVDFNGTFYLPIFNIPFTYSSITNSSQRFGVNITKLSVSFYINNFPTQDPNNPLIYRYSTLNLTARVFLENVGPIQGHIVSFYDDTRGGFEIGSDVTDVNGIASINYFIGDNSITGPNLLYVMHNMQQNYSYFILREEPLINILSGPTPREINRTVTGATNTQFYIEGEIIDGTNFNPISNCELTLKLLAFGDFSSNLIPSEYFWTDFNGYFYLPFEVAPTTPIGNYTLRLDFNGTIERFWDPASQMWQPYYFNLPIINTSSLFSSELLVTTPTSLTFNFWINGTTSNNYNQPIINRNGDLDLSVYLAYGGVPIGNGNTIYFYDITQGIPIGTATTNLGFAQILYSTDNYTVAGPHLLRARWGSNYNYSYFILDEPIIVDIESGPSPREVNRGQTIFNLKGYVNDSLNWSPIKFARISVYMVDGGTDYTSYLRLIGGSYQLGVNGEFDLTFSVLSSTPDKNYTLQIEFNGFFSYSSPRNYYNEHDFFLAFPNFNNSIACPHELKVIDPENLNINLAVEGNPTLPYYDNGNPPETYYFGDIAHIQVQVIHALPTSGNTVYLFDDFTNVLISSYILGSSGFVQFNISIDTLHAGLVRLRVNYHTYSTFNTTYIVINETIGITINSNRNVIQRNLELFNVNGNLQHNGTNLDGLTIGLFLLNDAYADVSAYMNFNGPQFRVVSNGNYFYSDNSVFLNCPPGNYYLLVYFTGSISETGISLINYMTNSISMLVPINITAGITINGNYDTRVVKDQFYEGDDLYAYGYLRWDNGSALANKQVNITIRDSLGNIITSAIGSTDINGFFNITIPVGAGWPDDAQIYVNFSPKDNFSAPYYYFIKAIEQQLFR